ncbi:MAG: hypothetical protein K9M10_01960 [Candidatus Pacebacteria bacterium]|nr:hypothetical protein [Candidatus Paceibacterota bacterium]MCF7857229.1 hypothetical protein [Candidatus Paceibacterota bacterium]
MRTSILQISIFTLALTATLFPVISVFAQESQILSVTPPLFQLSALPGDIWQSSVKVVNGNSYPLTVYAEVVNFKATGENGEGKFVPLIDEDLTRTSFASWIQISKDPQVIEPEQSKEISFFVEIPPDAPPGGHYAAILISTEPPASDGQKMAVRTSQAVTTLFFLRIEGDVSELGNIREFRAIDTFIEKPKTDFILRFENKGNVHLQPRGDIIITNMWGTQRGIIPINYQTHFGNVLPQSIREFQFTWESQFNITDIGRYKAVATLAYGVDEIMSVTSIAYFWVIPVKITLLTLAIIALFVALIVWMVKAYVRRMLTLAGVDVGHKQSELSIGTDNKFENRNERIFYRRMAAPIHDGVLDLRQQLRKMDESKGVVRIIVEFVLKYKMFFISICILIGIFITATLYIGKATEKHDNYKVIINNGDVETTIKDGSVVE